MIKIAKRRKSKDNPYTLSFNEDKERYILNFYDGQKRLQSIEITEEVYKTIDSFELEDKRQMNEYDRHIEHSELLESTLNNRAVNKPINMEEIIINKLLNDDLKNAINMLSETQKRRIKKYYFEDMKLREIATEEDCSIMSVKDSIDSGIEKLRKILKNWNINP